MIQPKNQETEVTQATETQQVAPTQTTIQTVHVGQVYADLDRRSAGKRKIEVTAIDEATGKAHVKVVGGDRTSWIRLDRFVPTKKGYQLISDNAGTEQTH